MQPRSERTSSSLCRYSTISGFDVVDRNDESVGSVDDMIFDCSTGQISRFIVKAGSVLGIGGKSLFVPFRALDINFEQQPIQVGRTKDELMNAPWTETMEIERYSVGTDYDRTAATYWGDYWQTPY